MYNILVKNKISKKGLERFSNNYNVSNNTDSPHAILVRSDSLNNISFNNELLAIARAGSGVNNIPVSRCSKDGIVVFNTPGANANSVKELVVSSIILTSRKMDKAMNWVGNITADESEFKTVLEKGKSQFSGREIKDKKLGVIGLGAIGTRVANSLLDLGMDVYGYDPYISEGCSSRIPPKVKLLKKLEDIFSICDYITLHVPLNSKTEKMINADSIGKMKNGVYILNFSRAELVDEKALKFFLDSKKIYSYITDFPTQNIVNVPGVIALPHIGASTLESEENCAIMAVDQVIDYLENGNIKNSVNFNDLHMKRSGAVRICAISDNDSQVIKNIKEILSKYFADIENIKSSSNDKMAYTLIDLKNSISNGVLGKLQEIKGISKVRVIKK